MGYSFLPLEETTSEKYLARRKKNKKLAAGLVVFVFAGWLCLLTIKLVVVFDNEREGLTLADEVEDIVIEMDIHEHGQRYKQTVSYNPSSHITTIYVPQHPGIDSSTTMYHQSESMQAMLNHDKKFCELSSLSESYETHSIVEWAKNAQNENTTLSHDNSAFMGLEIEVDHLLTDNETDKLPSEIQVLCSGMQIYKVRYVPTDLSEEDFNRLPGDDDNLNSTSMVAIEVRNGAGRVKRQDRMSFCSNNMEKCTYNRSWGRTCKWIICRTVEDPGNFDVCAKIVAEADAEIQQAFRASTTNALHIASAVRRCTYCCEDRANYDTCKCTDIIDKNSFNRCQLKNDCGFGFTKSRSCNDLWPRDYPNTAVYNRREHPRRSG